MTGNWTQFGVGVFIIIAPWLFGFSNLPLARWTDVLAGLVLVIINLWAIYGKGIAAASDGAADTSVIEASSMTAQAPAGVIVNEERRDLRKEAHAEPRPKRTRRRTAPALSVSSAKSAPIARVASARLRTKKVEKVFINS